MMKKGRNYKHFLCLLLIFSMLCSTAAFAEATAEPEAVIHMYIDAMTAKDYETVLDLTCDGSQGEMRSFLEAEDNEYYGLRAIRDAEIVEISRLEPNKGPEYAALFEGGWRYMRMNELDKQEDYSDNEKIISLVQGYLVQLDILADENAKNIQSGLNYLVVILASENASWKIVDILDADDALISSVNGREHIDVPQPGEPGSEIETVYRYIEAMTTRDWDTYLSLTVQRDRAASRQAIDDPSSGMHNVTGMEVVSAIGFDLSDEYTRSFLMLNSPLSACIDVYDELRVILLCVNVEVIENAGANFNGFDGRVAILAREDGEWRIAMFSSASKALMEAAVPEADRSRDFLRHMERLTLRYNTGLWVGDDGVIYRSSYVWSGLESFNNNMTLSDYTPGQFSDMDESAWYGAERTGVIESVYRMGIMSGMGDGTFAPNNTLTLAEAVTIASTIHSIADGNSEEISRGTPWYQSYVDYALEHDILPEGGFENYARPATRGEMACIFANALPDEALLEINANIKVPDVDESTSYAESILSLYRAGVVSGYEDGSFHPNADITRAEAASIIVRLVNPMDRSFVYQN